MSTSTKTPASIRQGGPGASHENAPNAKKGVPLEVKKPPADDDQRSRSRVSGGGGERHSHHAHDAKKKGGQAHSAH
ncbi:hypothetical protein [Neorhizobium sp. LjRoot104]|uniref:hypothetical protein n=1 Tax=Neorhizobium sp. LjRoot104 TaxID=3342254 RepID=UPI003ECF04D0